MAVNLGRDNLWSPDIWQDIDQAVLDTAGPLRTAQMIFETRSDGNGQYVPDDTIPPGRPRALSIPEARTRPYVELSVELLLTQSQVENESTLHTGRTLAMLAAKDIARAEDTLFFQGQGALPGDPLRVVNRGGAAPGLLGLAGTNVDVPLQDAGRPELGYGTNTFRMVMDGISRLTAEGQPGPYALVLATDVYADAFAPVGGTWVTPAERLRPLLAGGFYGTGALPARRGLLVSLGGQPTTIFIGQDMITAYRQTNAEGQTVLGVYERVQIIARDPNAIVRHTFV